MDLEYLKHLNSFPKPSHNIFYQNSSISLGRQVTITSSITDENDIIFATQTIEETLFDMNYGLSNSYFTSYKKEFLSCWGSLRLIEIKLPLEHLLPCVASKVCIGDDHRVRHRRFKRHLKGSIWGRDDVISHIDSG